MDYLWAPWRVKYISRLTKKNPAKKCVFCSILKEKKDEKNYIVKRSNHCFSVLNIYPYNNGHLMVMPYRHVGELTKLKAEEKKDLFELLEVMQVLLDKTMKPTGYNIGMNIGRVAGAGFPGHLHIHIVPRWSGDVNFMPVIANTKIISRSLNDLYEKLRHANQKRN